MSIPLTERLFVKQTRNAILIALCVGMVISISQIVFDFIAEQKRTDETVIQVINTSKQSAAEAAFNLNNELAQRVVQGLFEYRPIHYAEIKDDFGRRLAYLERPLIKHNLDWIAAFISIDKSFYTVALYLNDDERPIGEMRVSVDPYLIAHDFLDRAVLIVMSGLLRNCLLALLIGILFYFTLGRPVKETIISVSKIDPANPADHLVGVPQGHEKDELGELVTKINDVLVQFEQTLDHHQISEEELKRNKNTIQQLNVRLEDRVQKRKTRQD